MFKYITKVKELLRNYLKLEGNIKFQMIKQDYEKEILNFKGENVLKLKENGESQLIISLTTYNKRIHDVHLVIESLFRQTIKPNKIILWLAENEFDEDNVPMMLKNLQKKGLEIKYCKDLKSYKKLIPTLKQYPNDIIITVDDDIIYSYDLIEKLIKKYNKEKGVVCSRAHQYKLEKNYKFAPYYKWEHETTKKERLFLTSGAGTLFPPNTFDKDFFDEKKIFELCPLADDIWINAMLLKNNKRIFLIQEEKEYFKKHLIIQDGQDIALDKKNVGENKNDEQLKAVFDYYNLWEKLKIEFI